MLWLIFLTVVTGLVLLGLYLLRCDHSYLYYAEENGDVLEQCSKCGHLKDIMRAEEN